MRQKMNEVKLSERESVGEKKKVCVWKWKKEIAS